MFVYIDIKLPIFLLKESYIASFLIDIILVLRRESGHPFPRLHLNNKATSKRDGFGKEYI